MCSRLTSIVVENDNIAYDSRNNCHAIIKTSTNELIAGCKNTIIPDGVTSIRDYAFSSCCDLTSINIPESVTSIGDVAFYACYSLTSITIPNSVTSIGADAFGFSGLTSITIPESVTSIGSYAFYACAALTSITIPEGVTSIEYGAFWGCDGLNSITIPASVTSIGYNAFSCCDALTSIAVESGNSVYDSRENCNAIIKTSTNELIAGCKNTVIPASVTSIGEYAFSGHSGLTSITIPEGVTSIGYNAFSRSDGLTSVTVENPTPASIDAEAFPNRANATLYVPAGCKAAYEAAAYWNEFGHILDGNDVVLPWGAEQAWNMKYVNGESKDVLQEPALDSNSNPWYAEAYDDSEWETLTGPIARSNDRFTQVNHIWETEGSYYFLRRKFNVDNFTEGFYELYGICDNEMDAYLNGQKLNKTDLGNFNWSFRFPSSLLHVGENTLALYAFDWENCEGGAIGGDAYLDYQMYYAGTETAPKQIINFADETVKAICIANWDTDGDGELSYEEAATVTELGERFKENNELTYFDELQYFTGLTAIDDYAFYDCSNLASIILPESIVRIGSFSFHGCGNLSSFIIPENVTDIGENALEECCILASITIPRNVTSIGNNAFTSTTALASIVVEEGNTTYDSRNNCNAIIEKESNRLISGCNNTKIPLSVTSIGNESFSGRGDLTSITIPSSVTTIEYAAFFSCSGLTTIRIYSTTPPSTGSRAFESCTNATLYVPFGCKAAYESAAYWNDFREIVEMEETSNITFADANVKAICVANWDTNGDGELSYEEAAEVTELGEAFRFNSEITSFNELQYFTGLRELQSEAFVSCGELESISLPQSLTKLSEAVFRGNGKLRTITIPKSVVDCSGVPIWGSDNLESIIVEEGNPVYDSRNNCNAIIETATNTLINGCKATIIPDGITAIGVHAFVEHGQLKDVAIPNSVKKIGGRAFWGTGLTNISIPEGVEEIESEAFSTIPSLNSVMLPASLIKVNSNPFDKRAVTVVVAEGNPVYDSRDNCNAVIETISNKLIAGCRGTIIPNSVTSIGESAFYEYTGVEIPSITIPQSVTSIESNAFLNCNISEMHVSWPEPIAISDILYGYYSNAILFVPAGCREAYESAEYWQDFATIVEPEDIIIQMGQPWEAQYLMMDNWEEATDPVDGNGNAWYASSFDDSSWEALTGPMTNFDFNTIPGANFNWNQSGSCVYLRQSFNLDEVKDGFYSFSVQNDDAVKVYLNGVLILEQVDCGTHEIQIPSSMLVAGENKLAIYVDNRGGGDCYLDYGVYYVGFHPAHYTDEQGVHYKRKGNNYIVMESGNFWDVKNPEVVIPEYVCGYPVSEVEVSMGRPGSNELITSFSIPASITFIHGASPMNSLSNLREITVAEGNPVYDSRENCNAVIETATNTLVVGAINTVIPSSVKVIGAAAFDGRWFETYSIPDNVETIDMFAFYCTGKLKSIKLPCNLKSIGWRAFYASALESISIPASIESIDDEAFQCDGLTSVQVGAATPINISESVFTNRSNATLYVPVGSKAAYEAADYWKEFKKIVEFRETDQIENTLSVTVPQSLLTGKDASMSVNLTNEDEIIMAEFYLQLPEGISIAKDEDGYYDVTINSMRNNKHSVEVTLGSDGLYHFLCYSTKNYALKGNEGELFHVNLVVDENMAPGTNQALMKNILLVNSDRKDLTQIDYSFDIKVMNVEMGDANGDGRINGLDVVNVVDYILGRPSEYFVFAASDLTGDGMVNGMDLVKMVSLVMSQSYRNAPAMRLSPSISNISNEPAAQLQQLSSTEIQLGISSSDDFILAQFVVTLSDDALLLDVESDGSHASLWTSLGNGRYAVMVYSSRNASFSSNEMLARLTVSNGSAVDVTDMMVVDVDRHEHWLKEVHNGEATGINTIEGEPGLREKVIFDIQGRKHITPVKNNIYIVNGKKTFIK